MHLVHSLNILLGIVISVCCLSSCQEEDSPMDAAKDGNTLISNINHSDRDVSYRGATVSVKFDATVAWTASLKKQTAQEEEWVAIASSTLSGEAGEDRTVRIDFEKNNTSERRTVELWIEGEGFGSELAATLTQAASGTNADYELNATLNAYMHNILKEDYLWADAYNEQEVDLTVSYSEFLSEHLLSLGDLNEEDGGYYRASLANAGERYIYSNIAEVQTLTRAVQMTGLGFGPFLATPLADGSSSIGITPGFVRRGSPAEMAGLRRGDIIYAVNGSQLTSSNYQSYMTNLYLNPSGSYTFSYIRFEDDGNGRYSLVEHSSEAVVAGAYIYDPVLHASIVTSPNDVSLKIGYLVYESFDLDSQEFLKDAIETFAAEGIDELILDLRFNAGGAVAQSRWLSGCIAGESNYDKTFTKVVYNDGSQEIWRFDYGYDNDTDNLGRPTDLGLERLFVISSYNTASAAELVINSLRGIDFPVKIFGCRTEGKNVGMTVSETTYNGRRFLFSPVTFYVRNAKDFGDYADGMEPDEWVNNDNRSYDDDVDNVFPYSFADWSNMDFNVALQWAYCDITGVERWKTEPNSADMSAASAVSAGRILACRPLESVSLCPAPMHRGNLIEKQIMTTNK